MRRKNSWNFLKHCRSNTSRATTTTVAKTALVVLPSRLLNNEGESTSLRFSNRETTTTKLSWSLSIQLADRQRAPRHLAAWGRCHPRAKHLPDEPRFNPPRRQTINQWKAVWPTPRAASLPTPLAFYASHEPTCFCSSRTSRRRTTR